MFYLIHLYISLILICNNFVNSNENSNKLSWSCVNENCDIPISEVLTIKKYHYPDHNGKLRFEANQLGKAYKKPKDGTEYWFVEMGGTKGYIHKDFIRETKMLVKPTVEVKDNDPFASYEKNSNDGINPSPSQPTVVDGTTIYGEFIVADESKPLNPDVSNNQTPLLKKDKPGAQPSTPQDSVDTNNPSETNKASTETYSQESIDNINISSITNTSEDINNSTDLNEKPVLNEESTTEPSSSVNNLGVSSVQSLDDYDDDVVIEDDEEDEDEEIVPSESSSTNVNSRDQNDSNIKNNNDKQPFDAIQNSEFVKPPLNQEVPLTVSDQNNSSNDQSESSKIEIDKKAENSDQPSQILPTNDPIKEADQVELINNDQTQPVSADKSEATDSVVTVQNEIKKTVDSPELADPNVSTHHYPSAVPPYEVPKGNFNQPKPDAFNYGSGQVGPKANQPYTYPYNVQFPSYPNNPVEPDKKTESSFNSNEGSIPKETQTDTNFEESTTPIPKITPDNISAQDQITPENVPQQHLSEGTVDPNILPVETSTPVPNVNQNHIPYKPHEYILEETKGQPNLEETKGTPNHEETKETPNLEETKETPNLEETKEMPNLEETKEMPNLEETKAETFSENIDLTTVQPQVESVDPIVPPIQDEATTPLPQEELSLTSPELSDDKQEIENKIIDETQQTSEEETGFYSSISSFFPSLKELFSSSVPIESSSSEDDISTASPTDSAAPSGYCYNGESCGGLERPIGGEDHLSSHWSQPSMQFMKSSVPLSFNSILYICITSVVVLLFSLGYYYIDKSQNSSHLIGMVNKLSQELFVTKKERDTLEDQLFKIKENCNIMDSSKMKQDSKLSTLQNALEESESAKTQLEETVVRLEKEVETLMDQCMEMHKLLSETISDEERSQMLLSNIDELKESLGEKLEEIVSLTAQLDQKNQEILLKELDLKSANDKLSEVERKLESCKTETEETYSKKIQDHLQQIIKLQQLLEEKGVSIAKLENELAKTKVERDSADARASSAEAGLQAAHSVGAGEARQAWLDATSVRAALVTANKKNESLLLDINQLNSTNKSLQEKMSSIQEELSSLNIRYESAEKEKVNALTKLQVLSDYFKEKETKLEQELGMKESLWLQKESEGHTIYEQMKSLREEIASYKAQNEKLKAEILEQEASYKVQIANEGQKSHDNWVAFRQAERKIKELQMEGAHLRNRLTQIETANQSSDSLNPNGLEKSSFGAPSPPFMMLPPMPSAEFFPLPPPPIHPSASRPPPLGRISSPQLSGEMIPPPPLVPYDMYPPPPNSTSPPPTVFKPQVRDRPPPPKDSPPSNYSNESVNDKPARRRRDRR